MYNFVFYFIYLGQIRQKDTGPKAARIIASMIVSLLVLLHIGLLYTITRYLLFNLDGYDISFATGSSYSNKSLTIWLPVFVLIYIVVFNIYTVKKIERLKYKFENSKIYSFTNVLKFILIMVLPLLISIWLVNHSITTNR
jgi:hypothetical protein